MAVGGLVAGAIVALEAAVECVLPLAGLVLIAGTARLCRDDGYPGVDPREVRAMLSRLAGCRAACWLLLIGRA